jgi:hypothetical protein
VRLNEPTVEEVNFDFIPLEDVERIGGWDKFYCIVRESRKSTAMAAFKSILNPDEVRAIYEYRTSLPKL